MIGVLIFIFAVGTFIYIYFKGISVIARARSCKESRAYWCSRPEKVAWSHAWTSLKTQRPRKFLVGPGFGKFKAKRPELRSYSSGRVLASDSEEFTILAEKGTDYIVDFRDEQHVVFYQYVEYMSIPA